MGDVLLRGHGEIVYPVDGGKGCHKSNALAVDDSLDKNFSQLDTHGLECAGDAVRNGFQKQRTVEDQPFFSRQRRGTFFLI